MPMWTPFAHQPSRVQPVQARPSSNPSIFSAPSLLSCRAGALQQQAVLRSFPRCRCRVRSCLLLLMLLLPARVATSGGVGRLVGGTTQPHHSQHLIMDDSAQSLSARCVPLHH